MNLAISVSYCADHKKGPCYSMDAFEHVQMLRKTLQVLHHDAPTDKLIVAASGFRGFSAYNCNTPLAITQNLLTTLGMAHWTTIPENPGYPEGATFSIRMALEAAAALGCTHLVHMCEDVVPNKGAVADMANRIGNGVVYCGERWREKGTFSTQCFACDVGFMHANFNGYGENGLLAEDYLDYILRNQKISIIDERNYQHTHTYADFLRMHGER